MTNITDIDLHLHTTVSDGTDNPEELLAAVRASGLSLFSVTDHDALDAARILPKLLTVGDPHFLSGIEFTSKDETGKCHILGYGFDPGHPAMVALAARGHKLRVKKAAARLEFLKETFGIVFPEDEVKSLLSLSGPSKAHIWTLLVKYGYAKTREEALHDYLGKMYYTGEYISAEEAISTILASGGVPVLAHPFFGSGSERIPYGRMEERVAHLIGYGLQGLEVFYSTFPEEPRQSGLALAKKYCLYATAGSDYHGANKAVKIGQTGLDPGNLPQELLAFLVRFGLA